MVRRRRDRRVRQLLGATIAVVLAAALVLGIRWLGPAGAGSRGTARGSAVPQPTSAAPSTTPARTSAAAGSTTASRSRSAPAARSSAASRLAVPAPSRSQSPARPSVSPMPTSSAPVGSYPSWLPFHSTLKVGCVKSNCENDYHGYWAIDFETLDNKPGAPVYAAGSGRVRIASQGSGNCGGPGTVENALIVDHGNGVESVYVHLHDFAVAPGTWVTPDTVIGHIGSSGYTDPCPDYHLHYEVRINGASVNPGALKACHGSTLVTYPYALGYSDWNAITPQEYAGGKLDPRGRTLYSTGTGCG
ncbi:MAG TPA: peptidoglycan DD-metalloendopeptidase family protein [Jatrophihabitans sp.]|nr:peptidoglycan DD-metalloendopeptidase family protein [Jatrophihabitans sp.]